MNVYLVWRHVCALFGRGQDTRLAPPVPHPLDAAEADIDHTLAMVDRLLAENDTQATLLAVAALRQLSKAVGEWPAGQPASQPNLCGGRMPPDPQRGDCP